MKNNKTKLIKQTTILILTTLLILNITHLTQNTTAQTSNKTFGNTSSGTYISTIKLPNTIHLCNYTTPQDAGPITQINIYLSNILQDTKIKALIFANNETNLPTGATPIAQSTEITANESTDGKWFNFPIYHIPTPNTSYWIGYTADNQSSYGFEPNINNLIINSQPTDGTPNWIPTWTNTGNNIMNLYAIYTAYEPEPTPNPIPTPTPSPTPTPTATSTPEPTPTPTSNPQPTPTPTTTPQQTPTPTPDQRPDILKQNITTYLGTQTPGQKTSDEKLANTITLCNYTAHNDTGIIQEINIHLNEILVETHIKAVIFENEPGANFPRGGEPIAQSTQKTITTTITNQWLSFPMNYTVNPNSTYWIGYEADKPTKYTYNNDNEHLTVTSQQKVEGISWMPISWSYTGKTALTTCTAYTPIIVQPEPEPEPETQIQEETPFWQDIAFISMVMLGETVIITRNKKTNRTEKIVY